MAQAMKYPSLFNMQLRNLSSGNKIGQNDSLEKATQQDAKDL